MNDDELSVQLLVEIPSGFNVSGLSGVGSGNGQYSARKTISSGNTEGMRVTLSPNQSGRYEIIAAVVYQTGARSSRSFQSTSIPLLIE
jgi:hypothetical protein